MELSIFYYCDWRLQRPDTSAAETHVAPLKPALAAAAKGYPQALKEVAECHEYGFGVAANVAEAIRWYRRAQAAGHFRAVDGLDRLDA